jgi:hypothetical protein
VRSLMCGGVEISWEMVASLHHSNMHHLLMLLVATCLW